MNTFKAYHFVLYSPGSFKWAVLGLELRASTRQALYSLRLSLYTTRTFKYCALTSAWFTPTGSDLYSRSFLASGSAQSTFLWVG